MRFHTTVAALAVALLSGCNVIQQLESHKVLAAVVIRSPDVSSATVNVSGVPTAQVFFGERQADVTQPPSGLADASVTLSWSGAATGSVALPPGASAGWYQLTSTSIGYVPGATYTFEVVHAGEPFTASVVAPAAGGFNELDRSTVPNVFPDYPE